MLAKELKIKTIWKQREFIEKQLSDLVEREDGNTAYCYVGHVYSEVISSFEKEGFKVTKIESEMLTVEHKGLPAYLFVVDEDLVELSEEEKLASVFSGCKE